MRARTVLALSLAMIVAAMAPTQAAVRAGQPCAEKGRVVAVNGQKLTCSKVGSRLIWKSLGKPKPPIAPKQTPAPLPPKTLNVEYRTYTGGPGKTGGSLSLELPAGVMPPTDTKSNLRLWIYDPERPSQALGSTGIFRQLGNGPWELLPVSPNGLYAGVWPTGTYAVDTVEPNRDTVKYLRKRYFIAVSPEGVASVRGLRPNSQGIYTLTIDLRANQRPDSGFTAENRCQLLGQATIPHMNVGFPRRPHRLPAIGTVRAAFIPVDFPDVPGVGDPLNAFEEMAEGMEDFYRRASGGRVRFAIEVLPNWVRLGFPSTQHRLGTYNEGDALGYYATAIAQADPYIDYSRFDAVFVLSPLGIPRSSIAYGPAFPNSIDTDDGPLWNGTFSGADAYSNGPGSPWKWAAHEVGHLFGLTDLYTLPPYAATYGHWDLMAHNWWDQAIELNAWNRFTQGWLGTDQYKCLEPQQLAPSLRASLVPMGSDKPGLKALFVRLSDSLMLVVESRRTAGLDQIRAGDEGLLVYTVDMRIDTAKGAFKVQRRAGSVRPDFTDAALRPSDSVTIEGVRVTATTEGTVELTR